MHTGKYPINNSPSLIFLLSSSAGFVCKQHYNMICQPHAIKNFTDQGRTAGCVNFAGATLELLAALYRECVYISLDVCLCCCTNNE